MYKQPDLYYDRQDNDLNQIKRQSYVSPIDKTSRQVVYAMIPYNIIDFLFQSWYNTNYQNNSACIKNSFTITKAEITV